MWTIEKVAEFFILKCSKRGFSIPILVIFWKGDLFFLKPLGVSNVDIEETIPSPF